MYSHIMVGTNDMEAAKRFYDATLSDNSPQDISLRLERGPALVIHPDTTHLIRLPGSSAENNVLEHRYDVRIGAERLTRAALADEFAAASGKYFDNDSGRFASPHPDALDERKPRDIVEAIETVLAQHGISQGPG